MSAQVKNPNPGDNEDFSFYSIPEIVSKAEWKYLLSRLSSMQFQIPYSDKQAIFNSPAPDWIKAATFCCKTTPSA